MYHLDKCRVDTDCPPGQPCNNEGQCVVEGFFESDNPESKVNQGKHDEMSSDPVSLENLEAVKAVYIWLPFVNFGSLLISFVTFGYLLLAIP